MFWGRPKRLPLFLRAVDLLAQNQKKGPEVSLRAFFCAVIAKDQKL
jgi:hypothetical protein